MKVRIVQRTIQNLAPPKRGNLVTWDTEIPGFGVRITSTGVIAFVLDYRLNGRKRRFTIGRHPELSATAARERTLELRRGILDGRDPLERRAQDRDQPTLNELATEHLERHALAHKRPSSIRNDRQMIDVIIRPRLVSLPVKAVSKRDLELLHTSLKAIPIARIVCARCSARCSTSQWSGDGEGTTRCAASRSSMRVRGSSGSQSSKCTSSSKLWTATRNRMPPTACACCW